MESSRKVLAGIMGILVIVVLILLAKWTGDRIRERFLKPKTPVAVVTTQPVKTDNLLGDTTTDNTATYSAIPSTGPNDWLYAVAGIMFISGVVVKLSTKNFEPCNQDKVTYNCLTSRKLTVRVR